MKLKEFKERFIFIDYSYILRELTGLDFEGVKNFFDKARFVQNNVPPSSYANGQGNPQGG